jgi:hypothetical protein
VLPRALHARQDELFRGGVGGTAGEYSEFAPVDPEVGLSGGVGGTAGEYIRASASLASANGCDPIEAPVGTPVDPACLPFVQLQTRLGTPLSAVPVSWSVTAGEGMIAARSLGICGASGSTAETASAASGKTGVCWTLGDAGTNTIRATPNLGGDAAAGVVFSPETISFDAIANPPIGIDFAVFPPSTVMAGVPFDVSVRIVDRYHNQVMSSGHAVTIVVNQNLLSTGRARMTVHAENGYARFTGLRIDQAGAGYRLTVKATASPTPFAPAVSQVFTVATPP